MISGDLVSGNENCSEYLWNFYHDPNLNFFDKLLGFNESVGCIAINSLFSDFGVNDMLENSDAIVPLSSQLPGKVNDLSTETVSRFDGFSANHIGIKDRLDVGDKVMKLLNADIESKYFDETIAKNNSAGKILYRPSSMLNNLSPDSLIGYIDTAKIKILGLSKANIDSVVTVNIMLKDTANLKKVMITFEGTPYNSFSRQGYQNFTIQSSPHFYGKKSIVASAVYDSLGFTIYHSDTASIISNYDSTFTSFFVYPNIKNLLPGEIYMPLLNASHDNYTLNVDKSDTAIHIVSRDENVVSFVDSLRKFVAKDTGSTYAIITYKNLSDTIYFFISDTREEVSQCVNRTIASGNWKDPLIWEKGISPLSCDSVVILSGHNIILNASSKVNSLYISNGSSLTMNDSTFKLQVGDSLGGKNYVVNSGTLNISKGNLAINGAIKFNTGSVFNMTGGNLIIDGNTGSTLTSVDNGRNLFDASVFMNDFSFTGGTLQFIDPPLGNNSQAINCKYNFGDNSILKIGDGISNTASNNSNGFGGNLMPAQIGNFILDATIKTNNRHFVNKAPLSMKSPVMILSGNLIQSSILTIR